MTPRLALFGGTGHVLGRYAQLYPDEVTVEKRDAVGMPSLAAFHSSLPCSTSMI